MADRPIPPISADKDPVDEGVAESFPASDPLAVAPDGESVVADDKAAATPAADQSPYPFPTAEHHPEPDDAAVH
jgi:hypothetical protein